MKMDCVSSIQQAAAKPQAAAEHLHGAAEELHFFFFQFNFNLNSYTSLVATILDSARDNI